MFAPPTGVKASLLKLVSGDSALVLMPNGDHPPRLLVHPWPSWLTRGSPRVVDFFISFFYGREVAFWETCPRTCHIC